MSAARLFSSERKNTSTRHGNHLMARGDRPNYDKEKMGLYNTSVIPSFCSGSDHRLLRAEIRFDHRLEKNTCHGPKGRKQFALDGQDLLNEALSHYDCCVVEDPNEDYELLLRGLRICSDLASLPHSSRNARTSAKTRRRRKEKKL